MNWNEKKKKKIFINVKWLVSFKNDVIKAAAFRPTPPPRTSLSPKRQQTLLTLFPMSGYNLLPMGAIFPPLSSLSTLRKIYNIWYDVIYVLTSALCPYDVIVWKYIGKWRLTSQNDVTMSDFHQTCRKCLSHWYLTTVQVWSNLNHFQACFEHFSDLCHNMAIPIYLVPTCDKSAANFFLCMQSRQFFRNHAKLIYIKSRKKRGPSARIDF